ncbi:ABC transporter ATP-binding protein [Corynebacterium sp.]|uniref:ABC transporter ATP-binding protein n=1 Tax=Corynebacterium sp. TaxID=1720 RepID=UPI0026DBB371|nr:ABC transporter ATP-binding protein [Corynebacterium sp.]MDO4610752.1 ABC transporter ATP-binding protein [Corynebacterium sp.]
MLDATDLSLSRGGRRILHNVRATAGQGRVLGLVGPNGAGKSTLLQTLYKALIPDEGRVTVDGKDLMKLPRRHIARRISVVAQHAETTLPLPVRDSVALGRLARENLTSYGNPADEERVAAALDHVGIAHLADRLTDRLSGGELQRVLIARAIVQEADHLLLDEPTNHLDIHHQYLILQLIRAIRATTVVVLHDLNLAAQFCDELILLNNGTVVSAGAPFDVLRPDVVSDIYRIKAEVIEVHGRRHLVYEPPGHPPDGQTGNMPATTTSPAPT